MAIDAVSEDAPRVVEAERVSLVLGEEPWPWAEANKARIAQHWTRRQAENPSFFNGRILIMRAWRLASGHLEAQLAATDFAAFLYWRETGHPDRSVRDGFGSAVVRSREGHVLLGRQAAGGLNAGRAYFPGGFLDPRDVRAGGNIDIDASVARELAEETGLDAAELERKPGYYLTFFARQLSIGIEYRSPLSAEALAQRMRAGMTRDAERELAGVLAVADCEAARDPSIPGYAQTLLGHVLGP